LYVRDLFTTRFGPKGSYHLQVIGSAYIRIIKKSYWVMSGVYVNEISFLQLIGSY